MKHLFQVLLTNSALFITGRMTRNTKELIVVITKKIQKRIRSTAMATIRHSFNLFFVSTWCSFLVTNCFNARSISCCTFEVTCGPELALEVGAGGGGKGSILPPPAEGNPKPPGHPPPLMADTLFVEQLWKGKIFVRC